MADVLDKVIEAKFSIREAAERLGGVSEVTIRRELKRRKLGCYRLNGDGRGKAGRIVIGANHLRQYLDRFEVKAV